MENKKQLKKELKDIKSKLAELVDFTTTEEYFKLSEGERGLINQQRVGMELYLSCLTKRVYEQPNNTDGSNLLWMSILFGMFNAPFGKTENTKALEACVEESKEK